MAEEISRREFLVAVGAVGGGAYLGYQYANADEDGGNALLGAAMGGQAEALDYVIVKCDSWEDFESHEPDLPTLYLVLDDTDPGIEMWT